MNEDYLDIIKTYSQLTCSCFSDINENDELKKTIYYLQDNNFTKKQIINYLFKYGSVLDESLWEDSILKPDTFYYHEQLTIMPGPAIWNPNIKEQSQKFYLEMKIKYTIYDLLEYYYNELLIPIELRDTNKDKGAFEHMLKKYINFKVEPIDFVLYLIDYTKQERKFITNVFDLQVHERETYEKINYITENNIYKNIIWRT